MLTVLAATLGCLAVLVEADCGPPDQLTNGAYEPVKSWFKPKENVTYFCDSGHYAETREGKNDHTFHFECQYVNRWSAVVNGNVERAYKKTEKTFTWLPECMPFKKCERPTHASNVAIIGDPGKTVYESDDVIRFRCTQPGEIPQGSDNAVCSVKGQWSSPPPRCLVPRNCPVPTPTPNMKHEPDVAELFPGQTIKYKCDHGYQVELQGKPIKGEGEGHEEDDFRSHTRTCLVEGRLDGEEPVCKLFTCNKGLTSIEHGNAYFQGRSTEAFAGDVVHYRCPPEYRLIGDNVQHCQLYHGWVGEKPFCGLKYCITPKLSRGEAIPNRNTFHADEEVQFKCFEGYVLVGPSSLTCSHNFDWSSDAIPICHPSHDRDACVDQGIPHNGYRFITHHHRSTSVQYGCEDGFRLIGKKKLRCRDDIGRWTGVPPLCKSKYSFPDPQKEALRLLSRLTELMTSSSPDGIVTFDPAVLYLTIDLSGSQANESVASAVNFLRPVVHEIMKLPSSPKIAIVGFTGTTELLLSPSDYADNVTAVMDELRSKKASTNIADALDFVKVEDETRHDANEKKIVILASDGLYNAGGNPESQAEGLKEAGFDVLLLTMTVSTLREEIKHLASNATTDIFYIEENTWIDENFKLPENIDYSACGITTPYNPHPWNVEIHHQGRMSAPGVIIGTEWVMALLVEGPEQRLEDLSILYGEGRQQRIGVSNVTVLKDHFVLLKTEEKLDLGPAARPVCVPVPMKEQETSGFRPFTRNRLYDAGVDGKVNNYLAKIADCKDMENSWFCADIKRALPTRPPPTTPEPTEAATERPKVEEEEDDEIEVTTQKIPDEEFTDVDEDDYEYEEYEYEEYEYEEYEYEEYDYEDYDYGDYDEFYTTPVVPPPQARRRRDVTSFEHGDAFIGRVANRLDLRDRRFVLSGFYSAEKEKFMKAEKLSMSLYF